VSQLADYSSPYMGFDEIFARYETTQNLTLLDLRESECHPNFEELESYEQIDGFISREDFIEIYLKNPKTCVDENFKYVDFIYKPNDFDYNAYASVENAYIETKN